MTRGAMAERERKTKEKEIASKEKIEANKLKDNERQRLFEKGENRKNRIVGLASSFIKGIKLPTRKNDPAYYKKFIDNLDRFVNIPSYQRLGAESFATSKFTHFNNGNGNYTIPGIMVFTHYPTIGPEPGVNTAQYPVNQSLNRDKEQILKLNSRSSVNYEGADIGLNIFCTAEIVTLLCEIRRALLIYQTYKGDNAYLAKAYIQSLGIDFADLDTNIAEYRKRFVVLVKKFNSSIVAPADITLYARKIYLATNVFKDREGDVKQVYMFKQGHFHCLNAVGDGTTIFTKIANQRVAQYFVWLDSMIESITANPDYVEMYADMRHAIPNLLELDPEIKADDTIQFNSDSLNREQIHNIRTLPRFGAFQYSDNAEIDPLDWSLHIDTNGYLFQGSSVTQRRRVKRTQATGDTTVTMANWLLMLQYLYSNISDSRQLMLYDMDKDEITGDDILDITRFNIGTRSTGNYSTHIGMDITDCGTEVVGHAEIYTLTTDGNLVSTVWTSDLLDVAHSGAVINITWNSVVAYVYSKFDWAPNMWRYDCSGTTQVTTTPKDSVQRWAHLGDLNHSFAISFNDLASINEACVLSEFYLSGTTFKN